MGKSYKFSFCFESIIPCILLISDFISSRSFGLNELRVNKNKGLSSSLKTKMASISGFKKKYFLIGISFLPSQIL